MNNKYRFFSRRMMIILVLLLCLLLIGLVFLVKLCIAGDSSKNGNSIGKVGKKLDEQDALLFIQEDLANMRAQDGEGDKITPNFILELEKRTSIEVERLEYQDGLYTATVCVEVPALYDELMNATTGYDLDLTGTEDIDNMISAMIEEADIVKQQGEVYILVTSDGTFITYSDTFLDVLYGGIYSYYLDSMDQLSAGGQEQ